jgi:hypothetical protein
MGEMDSVDLEGDVGGIIGLALLIDFDFRMP